MPRMWTQIQRSQQSCQLRDQTRSLRQVKAIPALTLLLIWRCPLLVVQCAKPDTKAAPESQQPLHVSPPQCCLPLSTSSLSASFCVWKIASELLFNPSSFSSLTKKTIKHYFSSAYPPCPILHTLSTQSLQDCWEHKRWGKQSKTEERNADLIVNDVRKT